MKIAVNRPSDAEGEELKKRLLELAERSYSQGQFTFTSFLGLSEVSIYHSMESKLRYASPTLFGGYEDAERGVVRFGNPETMGYDEDFPIDLLEIAPLALKFSDDLTHRDFLGALMSLGIERSLLGDIVQDGNKAYVFCLSRISEYIIENLISVKHTSVSVRKINVDEIGVLSRKEMSEKILQVVSLRCDAVISKVYNLSRNESTELFRRGKVFVNGCVVENTSYVLKEEDAVTVRGFGRFVYAQNIGLSRKEKVNIRILS